MPDVDAAETAVDGSTEEPNLKTGPAELKGFAVDPKMLPLKVIEVLGPVETKLVMLDEEENSGALPVDI